MSAMLRRNRMQVKLVSVSSRPRMLANLAVAAMMLMLMFAAGTARAELRTTLVKPAATSALNSTPSFASASHSLVATTLATLPPEEKPKTHWPWWLRILAVVGVLVFIRLVAGSMRNKPGAPGPNGS